VVAWLDLSFWFPKRLFELLAKAETKGLLGLFRLALKLLVVVVLIGVAVFCIFCLSDGCYLIVS
jgi:hypothetical protein